MSNHTNETQAENPIGNALKVFAIATIIIGLLLGIVMAFVEVPYETYFGGYDTKTEFSWTIALTYWSDAFVAGIVFLGFAEIITLLQTIVDKFGGSIVLQPKIDAKPEPEQFSDLPKL